MKILVVEDSMLYRKVIVKYMKELLPHAQFITAVNGREGYELFQKEKPDTILLDLLMPDMNGIQLLELVKQENPATKVVVISSDVQKATREEVKKLGALKFFPKPFSREQAAEIAALLTQ